MNAMSSQVTHVEQERPVPAILDYLGVMVRWRKVIIRLVLVTTVLVAVLSMLVPKTFQSRAVIVPTQEGSGLDMYNALSGSLLGLALGRGSTELYLLKALLESRTLREHIVGEFHLELVYDADHLDAAIMTLADHITVTLTEDNTLEVSFEHQTGWFSFSKTEEETASRFSQQVASAIIRRLDLLNRSHQGREARDYRMFIEERFEKIGQELAAFEDSLSSFQEKQDVTVVDAQLQATLEAAAMLEAEEVKRELEFAIAKITLGADSRMIENKRSELLAAKSAFETSLGGQDEEKRFLFGYDRDLPKLMKEYLRLRREIEIHSEVFAFITTKYEESKLREAQNIPTISILDSPKVPDMRTAPRRAFLVITTGILMSIFAVLVAFVLDFFKRTQAQFPDKYAELIWWPGRLSSRQT